MKIDNAIFEIDNAPCGLPVNPLFGWTWRVGGEADAPDCKSVRQISHLRLVSKAENAPVKLDKTPGHSANEGETLTTPSAWLPLVLIASLPVWAWIVGGVV